MSVLIPSNNDGGKIYASRSKEIRELRNKEIRALYRIGYTMEEICKKVNVSKTTVFFALRGRPKKKLILKNKKVENNH